jgi:heat shock protein HtpX
MNSIKTTMLLAVLAVIFILVGDMIAGREGAVMGLVFAALMNVGAYWFSDKVVLKMYGARQVEEGDAPELHVLVRDLSMKAGLPMPKVYMMQNETPNAFATGRNPEHSAVAVTTGIMRLLSTEELSGVIGHELSHIQNRDILISTVAATIAGAISYLYYIGLFFGGRNRDTHPAVFIVMLIVAPLAAGIIRMAISRTREFGADAGGARIAGNPLYLSEALKKLAYYNKRAPMQGAKEATAHMFIVNPLTAKGFSKLFSTHPPIEERVKRLEASIGVAGL